MQRDLNFDDEGVVYAKVDMQDETLKTESTPAFGSKV